MPRFTRSEPIYLVYLLPIAAVLLGMHIGSSSTPTQPPEQVSPQN